MCMRVDLQPTLTEHTLRMCYQQMLCTDEGNVKESKTVKRFSVGCAKLLLSPGAIVTKHSGIWPGQDVLAVSNQSAP